ncbi:hypothetical protein DL764_001746 [Monosporascus ibericus]|uniref:DUF7918 domain-containing protein n=1 Tax=Monosporascus ibericus TaxID=155417 RepID=A0A4Q4TNC2_9PEZI|nr:hypothetical protein DL764_001746 [Monosporascus ibericus]
MAIIKEVPGLKAQIVDVKGAPLKEYDDPYAEESDEELQLLATATKEGSNVTVDARKIPHVIKYMEAISGAEFGFEFIKFPNFEHRSHHLAFRSTFTLPNTRPVLEKALKGRAVTHKIDCAPGKPGIPSRPRQVDAYQDPLKRPFAVFEFRYRSREGLIAESVIPRPTPMGDMDEQQLRQFALQLYRGKEDRDMSVKSEVKTGREARGRVKRRREESELTPTKRSKGTRSLETVDLAKED